MIRSDYTTPDKLAIKGGSNGGLLVAVCAQQRPELFGAVITDVGVLDMLRFHKFTIGAAWVPEFGSPDVPGDFDFIYKYSPLHNIQKAIEGGQKAKQQWPATLLMSADHDDRVVPCHTLKYIAELHHQIKNGETCNYQKKPIIARIDVKAGHGSGKPTAKLIADVVDFHCFLQRVLGMEWRD